MASFLAGAFILSLLSDLDCIFIRVDVGFVPVNIPEDDFNSSSVFGLGIWSFEDPKSAQVCVFPNFDGKDNHQGLTEDDHVYDNFLVAGDAFFTTIRIFAMFSMLVGLALVVSWRCLLKMTQSLMFSSNVPTSPDVCLDFCVFNIQKYKEEPHNNHLDSYHVHL